MLPLAVPIAAWWLIGDLSFRPGDPDSLDYMWRQPAVDPVVENLVGIAAALTVVASLAVLVRAARKGALDPRWWLVVVLVAIGGAAAAAVERAVTAGVVGANIGGGLALFLGVPLVALLLLSATTVSAWILLAPFGPLV